MSDSRKLRLATRGSALALWQANRVRERVAGYDADLNVELVIVSTSPDRKPETPLAALGGDKGLFVAEVEQAIRDGRADAAVHSLKDVPAILPDDMRIAAYPERAEVRDALLSKGGLVLADLPRGARVATSALRRRGQLLHVRADLKISEIRGNVDTRVRKLRDGQFDAMVLAAAGLMRLGMAAEIAELLPLDLMLPASGQGAIAIESPMDSHFGELWKVLDAPAIRTCVETEREFVRAIGADCNSAAGCLCEIYGDQLRLRAVVVHPDGTARLHFAETAPLSDALLLAQQAATSLLSRGAGDILHG